jgi:hypothetical protein
MTEPTQAERVLAYIAEHPGATALDIAQGCHPWVSNPRARISDLRQMGHNIECRKRGDGRGNGFWIVPQRVVDAGEQMALEVA